eukprot:CAMPEP_0178399944 /NCGR_PEP_ID=MMETSP0689_2-20121128/15536_1 /TAXON_ID=160604 /ORGANISM="Amphidinium massartii, Strain CS-259" /LENGTH=117 /DNA_ID=CAMNT_0020020727 /DNA_START=77 /DNA_END=428 /DNA_ORIENTATION=+
MDALKKAAMDKALSAGKSAATAAMQNETVREKAKEMGTKAVNEAMNNPEVRKKVADTVIDFVQKNPAKAAEIAKSAASAAAKSPNTAYAIWPIALEEVLSRASVLEIYRGTCQRKLG